MRLFSKLPNDVVELRRIALSNKKLAERYRRERDNEIRDSKVQESKIESLEADLLECQTENRELKAEIKVKDTSIELLSLALEKEKGRHEVDIALQERTRALNERRDGTQSG